MHFTLSTEKFYLNWQHFPHDRGILWWGLRSILWITGKPVIKENPSKGTCQGNFGREIRSFCQSNREEVV